MRINEHIADAERHLVAADAAEERGDLATAKREAVEAGWRYERAALDERDPADKARLYRQAQLAYRRGGSTGRAFRMGCRVDAIVGGRVAP